MAADYESGMLAAAPNDHTAVDGRERSVTGTRGSLAALDQDGAQPACRATILHFHAVAGGSETHHTPP
jgi:hypothetical protein